MKMHVNCFILRYQQIAEMIFQTRSCAAMKERQIFFLSKQNIFLTFSLKFMIVYDILCVSVFLHSTNDRHARTFFL